MAVGGGVVRSTGFMDLDTHFYILMSNSLSISAHFFVPLQTDSSRPQIRRIAPRISPAYTASLVVSPPTSVLTGSSPTWEPSWREVRTAHRHPTLSHLLLFRPRHRGWHLHHERAGGSPVHRVPQPRGAARVVGSTHLKRWSLGLLGGGRR
jgi:hypothetical protein